MNPNLKYKAELCMACNHLCCVWSGTISHKSMFNKELLKFMKLRGHHIWEYVKTGMYFVYIKSPCPNLTGMGCKIYPIRPDICRRYDGRQDPFLSKQCKWIELGPSPLDLTEYKEVI